LLSAGETHACGIKLDGSLACWGVGLAAGQGADLGAVPPGKFKQVSTGANFACAITQSGQQKCWGVLARQSL
jgi:hypothetical protein